MIEEQIEEVKVKNEKTLIRRIVALGIDFIVLGIIGFILGLIFKSFLALTGVHGILIGWILSSIYFTLGNSKPLSGQTIGKAIMS